MLQDETIIINNRVLEIKDNIAKIDSSIKNSTNVSKYVSKKI